MRHLKRINESLNTKSISKEEFMNLLNQSCQKFINYGTYLESNLIFRCMQDFGDYLFVDPKSSTKDRIAPYARYNFHNLLISNLESWAGWPRRNKSLICASSHRALRHGGGEVNYLVIPFDKTKIASGDRSDFWDCFPNIPFDPRLVNDDYSDRTAISYWMTGLINDLGYKGDWSKLSTNWSELKSFLEDADDVSSNNSRFESAENSIIDKRIKDIARDLLLDIDIVEFDQSEFEDTLQIKVNQALAERGVRINYLSFVPTPSEQTEQAIDVATAMKIYESKGLQEVGKQVIANKAGATKIEMIVKTPEKEGK